MAIVMCLPVPVHMKQDGRHAGEVWGSGIPCSCSFVHLADHWILRCILYALLLCGTRMIILCGRLWTHKQHSIARPHGRAMECHSWVLEEKCSCYKDVPLYYCASCIVLSDGPVGPNILGQRLLSPLGGSAAGGAPGSTADVLFGLSSSPASSTPGISPRPGLPNMSPGGGLPRQQAPTAMMQVGSRGISSMALSLI